jgi:hypothetical protein
MPRKISEMGIPIMQVRRRVNGSETWINEADFDPELHEDLDAPEPQPDYISTEEVTEDATPPDNDSPDSPPAPTNRRSRRR